MPPRLLLRSAPEQGNIKYWPVRKSCGVDDGVRSRQITSLQKMHVTGILMSPRAGLVVCLGHARLVPWSSCVLVRPTIIPFVCN